MNIPGEFFSIDFEFREAIPDNTIDPSSFIHIRGPPGMDCVLPSALLAEGFPAQTSSFPTSSSPYSLK